MLDETKDIYWLAGLLEGEGFFLLSKSNSPIVGLRMTDLDIVERAKSITKATNLTYVRKGAFKTHKTLYEFRIFGNKALELMNILLPLMGERRQIKIKEILEVCKNRPFTKNKLKIVSN